jgi:uncharacterized protein DUF4375
MNGFGAGDDADRSLEAIERASDEDLTMLVWDMVWPDGGRSSTERRTFFLVELLNAEIGNGGLVQYFHNTEDSDVVETSDALDRMGANEHRAVFDEALRRWEGERSMLESLWVNGVEGFSQSYQVSTLCELDDTWDIESIESVAAEFIRANAEAFAS